MEGLAPPHRCLLFIRHKMEGGTPLSASIRSYLAGARDSFTPELARWFMLWEQGGDVTPVTNGLRSPYRRAVLEILGAGLSGHPIHQRMIELEEEVGSASRVELEKILAALPFRTLIPLLLFQFPALLLLFLGPFFASLLRSFES